MSKKYEKESVTFKEVPATNGGTLIKLEMVISRGKLSALQCGLDNHGTDVSKDLLGMIERSLSTFYEKTYLIPGTVAVSPGV